MLTTSTRLALRLKAASVVVPWASLVVVVVVVLVVVEMLFLLRVLPGNLDKRCLCCKNNARDCLASGFRFNFGSNFFR